jgi:hypothetical protein
MNMTGKPTKVSSAFALASKGRASHRLIHDEQLFPNRHLIAKVVILVLFLPFGGRVLQNPGCSISSINKRLSRHGVERQRNLNVLQRRWQFPIVLRGVKTQCLDDRHHGDVQIESSGGARNLPHCRWDDDKLDNRLLFFGIWIRLCCLEKLSPSLPGWKR